MLFGASTFIWTSPFSNETLSLIDHAKGLGLPRSVFVGYTSVVGYCVKYSMNTVRFQVDDRAPTLTPRRKRVRDARRH